MARTEVRREELIRAINSDANLTVEQKTREIQNVFTGNVTGQKRKRDSDGDDEEETGEEEDQHDDFETTFHNFNNEELGCLHYSRACKIKCPTCFKYYTCHLCHDEKEKHKINRRDVCRMLCMICDKKQNLAKYCKYCDNRMGRYYCRSCALWDDRNNIYHHCTRCRSCRFGREFNYKHCDKCNACLPVGVFYGHFHVINTLDKDCPICQIGPLKDSSEPVYFSRCGHTMHTACYKEYIKHDYKCPLCRMSISDTTDYFNTCEIEVMLNPMPAEYRYKIKIQCHDCPGESEAWYNWIHLQCLSCGSFNVCK